MGNVLIINYDICNGYTKHKTIVSGGVRLPCFISP